MHVMSRFGLFWTYLIFFTFFDMMVSILYTFQLMNFVNVIDMLSLCTIMKRRATPSEGVSNRVVNVTTNLVIVFMINKGLLGQKSVDSMCATSI